jgi:hypothetical protein
VQSNLIFFKITEEYFQLKKLAMKERRFLNQEEELETKNSS